MRTRRCSARMSQRKVCCHAAAHPIKERDMMLVPSGADGYNIPGTTADFLPFLSVTAIPGQSAPTCESFRCLSFFGKALASKDHLFRFRTLIPANIGAATDGLSEAAFGNTFLWLDVKESEVNRGFLTGSLTEFYSYGGTAGAGTFPINPKSTLKWVQIGDEFLAALDITLGGSDPEGRTCSTAFLRFPLLCRSPPPPTRPIQY